MRPAIRLTAVACLALVSTVGVVPSAAAPAAPAARTVAASSSAVTVSKTVQRTFLDDGVTTVVDKRHVSLTVDVTTKLQTLQLINVSWSGAHPTGALYPDQNSDSAQSEEYPFALFECRGVDSAAHPLSPDTCWTKYSTERFTTGSDDPPYPAWRADSAATPAQRAAFVDAPSKLNDACKLALAGTTVQRWVPFQGADGTVYPGGANGCAGQPPEGAPLNLSSSVALPSNETFGVTDGQGNGSAAFDVFTSDDHISLGCSVTVACSLVAVPIMGLSCDPSGAKLPADQRPDADGAAAAKDACEAGPQYKPGTPLTKGQASQTAVNGSLWWSPSNWANRLAVPLKFAPSGNACSLDSSDTGVSVFGSELMSRATQQWEPSFCLNKNLFDFKHVQTPESLARRLLDGGSIEAAFGSSPPDTPFAKPTVQAPVAITGFGIGYTMDDKDGREITGLKLDARLIAKLLTSSYPDIVPVRQGHPGLTDNPYNITQDPEFQALNPGVPVRNIGTDGAASLLSLNSDSDTLHALTAYVAADPEARAWLDGTPDPWGMTVNPSYKKIALPASSLALLDDYIPQAYYDSGNVPCLQGSKVPYLQYVAAPTTHLFSIAQDLEFALVQSQTTCVQPSGTTGDNTGAKMVASGRQDSGNHAMFGLVALADAARGGVQVASLETYATPAVSGTKFTDASGRSFATADTAGLRAAATALKPDTTAGVWPVPYSSLRSTAHADAYPGTMVVYADVPTSGLPHGDGAKFAKLLDFAAGAGQQPGIDRGQLPAGYLPMTSANGLGSFVAYTRRAAKAVGAQQGYLPSLVHADPPASSSSGSSGSSGGSTAGGSQSGTGTGAGGNGGSVPVSGGGGPVPTTKIGGSAAAPTKSAGSSTAPSSTQPTPALAAVRTPTVGAGIGGWFLPVLLLLAIAAIGAGLATRLGSRA